MEIPREFVVIAEWRNDGKADLGLMCEVAGCRWYVEWDADGDGRPAGGSASLPELVNAALAHKAERHADTPE